jgi:thioredoxin reductase (NADPH)
MNTQPDIRNVVIIGGGPSGLAAGIYNARANLYPLILAGSPPGGQLMLTTEVENYPGYPSILGPELIQEMRTQAKESGADIKDSNVINVDFSTKPFLISTSDDKIRTHSVIIATGAQALWLNIDSEQRLRGRGVSACATCDGLFFRNKVVAVVGGGDTALEEALTLSKITEKVYVIHRRDSFRASSVMQERVLGKDNIEVLWNTEVREVQGEQKVEGLLLWNNKEKNQWSLPVSGVFIAIGHKPDTDIFRDHVAVNDKGYIYTSSIVALEKARDAYHLSDTFDFHYQTMTSREGVFAGGDCVDYTYRQASTAVGMGVAASLDAERWLSELEF